MLLVVLFWRPLQGQFLDFFLVRAEAPSEEILTTAVEQAGNPGALLNRLWRTERVPHRQFVINYLDRNRTTKPYLFEALKPLLFEAIADPDVETRQFAFAALGRAKDSQLRQLAVRQLSDADPAVRIIGLQCLRGIATSNDVALAHRFLDDPEPRVVVAAALVLRQIIGEDFGIKSSYALPQFTCIDTNPPPAPEVAAIKAGVQRWHEWWISNQARFPAAPDPLGPSNKAQGLSTKDFSLEADDGKIIRVSQYRGKAVLLAFWSVGAPASLDNVLALMAVQKRNPDRLAVLGICIPAAPSCADEHDHGHEHAHHHGASPTVGSVGDQMRSQIREAAARLKITFPMLMDPKGEIGSRFKADDLPIYLLIDGQGIIRRRSVGFRTERDLEMIVEQTLKDA